MIFKRLELKNFKSHADTTIDFNTGVTLVIGENGAGKSSIFEAITFALFKESADKNKYLVRTTNDPNDRTKMEVKLTFETGGNTYRVERTITKTRRSQSPTAVLIKIDDEREEPVVEGVNDVTREIGHILNMNTKTFTNSIHIKQGEISDLIDNGPSERKELIGQLLRLDDLKKAHAEMPKVIKDYELIESELKGGIKPQDELDLELVSLNNDKIEIINQTNQCQTLLEEIKNEYDIKTAEKTQLDEQKAKLEKLKASLETEEKILEQSSKTHKDLIGKLNEITEHEEEMRLLMPSTEKLQVFNSFKESLYQYNQMKRDETSIMETLENIKIHKCILEDERESHEKYLQLSEEINELALKETALSSEVNALEELEKKLQRLNNELNDNNKSLNEAYSKCQETLSNYDMGEIDFENLELEDIEGIVENLKNDLKVELTQIDEKVNELNNQIGGLKQEMKSAKKALGEITKVDGKCPTCQSEITPKTKNGLISDYENTISNSKEQINENNKLIDGLNEEKSLKNAKLNKLESIENIIRTNKHVPKQINTISNNIYENEEKIAELKTKQQELNELIELKESKSIEFESLEIGYKKYLDSQTLLSSFEDEENVEKKNSEISNALKEIELELDEVIKDEPALSLDISSEDLNREIEMLAAETTRYNILEGRIKDKAEYESKLKESEAEIENKIHDIKLIKKSIESCGYDHEKHERIDESVTELGGKIQTINTNITINKTNLANNDDKIKSLELEIEENKKRTKKLNDIKDYIYVLKDFREFYGKNGIQKDLRSQSTPLIQKYAREFFDKFNFNYSDLKLSDEYDISVYGPKGKVKLGMVSGGEKIAIALSLRLAITQVMSEGNIETILLDEPTIHLDSYRRQELITVLQSMSAIPQMIIVTHDEELESAANTLIKIEKHDGISKVIDDE